jgi:hypothetical protein
MRSLNPERLRLPTPQSLKPKPSARPPRHKPGGRFLKGPIPWNWLCVALSRGGRAGAVGVALWLRAGLTRKRSVKLPYSDLSSMRVNRYAAWRGLRLLEAAGLVSVERRPGCTPEVTILDAPSTPTPCPSNGAKHSKSGRASCNSTASWAGPTPKRRRGRTRGG